MADRSVLVTGATSGIGYQAARTLKARGWHVFAGVRSSEDRRRLEGEGLETVRLDYSDAVSIRSSVEHILAKTGGQLSALVNNGAYSQLGAVEDLTTEALRRQFDANVFGWHELTRRVIPVMRARGSGRIIQMSSVLGYVSGKYRGAYAASKFAIEALSDALRMELAGTGIHVVLIEPGPIETNFIGSAVATFRQTIDVEGSAHREAYEMHIAELLGSRRSTFSRDPSAVVAAIIEALDNPRPNPRYRITLPAKAAWYLRRFLSTRLLDRILARQ